MTESEWLAATEPEPIISFLRNQDAIGGYRAGLRFSITCCRLSWDHLEPQERAIAEILERFAATPTQRSVKPALKSLLSFLSASVFPAHRHLGRWSWWYIANTIALMTRRNDLTATIQTDILRDIVGNPFREVTFDPEWRSAAVVALAEFIKNGDHTHYPILADALLEAGCRDETFLDHCRQSGRHFKHCWVIEGLLKPHADAVGDG
jgi:hypothetical protein